MSNPKEPAQILNRFGREYIFQGILIGTELEKTQANWQKINHYTMILNGNKLYASRYKKVNK